MSTPTWDKIPWNLYSTPHEVHGEAGLVPGRVVAQEGPILDIATPDGLVHGGVSGRLQFLVDQDDADWPAIGDYVLVARTDGGNCQVERVLPRSTVYQRKEAGQVARAQVLCANADVAMIMTTAPRGGSEPTDDGNALNDFSVRRLERYLATLDMRIRPIVILNKIDLISDVSSALRYARAELPGVTIVAISALAGTGVDLLLEEIHQGETAVLVGSSGCGKSTLVGRLLGEDVRTGAVRSVDGRGRHTTTDRRMYLLSNGALLVDTPGLREVQLWSTAGSEGESVEHAFPEIAELTDQCRFRDCRHEGEPGCAVQEAVRSGAVTQERYLSYLELRAEAHRVEQLAAKRTILNERRVARRSRMKRRSRGG